MDRIHAEEDTITVKAHHAVTILVKVHHVAIKAVHLLHVDVKVGVVMANGQLILVHQIQ